MPRLTLFSLVALAVAPAAHGNLLTNGTFDVFVPTNSPGGGWNSSDVFNGWIASNGNPGPFFGLNSGGAASNDPTVFQTVDGLVVGEQYTIAGDYKVNLAEFGSPANSFAVLVDSVQVETFDPPGPIGFWGSFSVDFVATAESQVIGFAGEANGSDYDYGVDNLSVSVVPEPAALGLLAIGSLGLLRRRGV